MTNLAVSVIQFSLLSNHPFPCPCGCFEATCSCVFRKTKYPPQLSWHYCERIPESLYTLCTRACENAISTPSIVIPPFHAFTDVASSPCNMFKKRFAASDDLHTLRSWSLANCEGDDDGVTLKTISCSETRYVHICCCSADAVTGATWQNYKTSKCPGAWNRLITVFICPTDARYFL